MTKKQSQTLCGVVVTVFGYCLLIHGAYELAPWFGKMLGGAISFVVGLALMSDDPRLDKVPPDGTILP